MHIHRTPGSVVIDAPAKLNLFLEVTERRDDGFHEIETVMVPVSIYDTVHVRLAEHNEIDCDGQVELTCDWAEGLRARSGSTGELPAASENLVVRALRRLRESAGIGRGMQVRLVKRIPTQAGLGGASSDAAAALLAANELWELRWPLVRLERVARELGSDVPFFLYSQPAVCRGRGEEMETFSLSNRMDFIVVRPPAGLATADVYGHCRPAASPWSVEPMRNALRSGNLAGTGHALRNRLEPAAADLTPWIQKLRNLFTRLALPGHQMSGSGTSYFGLCHHHRHARCVARKLRASGWKQVASAHLHRPDPCSPTGAKPS